MKAFLKIQAGRRRKHLSAFTLVEIMISAGVYLVIFVGVMVAIQVFALRVYTLAATKLTATQSSRKALNQIRDDIRQGKLIQVGKCDNSGSFTAVAGTNGAIGNAIQIFGTTNLDAPDSIYYLQPNPVGRLSSNNLMSHIVTSASSPPYKLSTYITNLDVFAAEDCYGNTISNVMKNNQVFTIKLQFYQWEYPIAYIATNGGANAYNYYQLRTKVCRRALD